MSRSLLLWALPWIAVATPGAAQSAAGLSELAIPRTGRAMQFSSHDPSGANEDHGHFLRVETDGTRVLAEATGPGRVTRIWSANPAGRLKILIDTRIVFDGPFDQLFNGTLSPFVPPLASHYGGGATCCVPLPFLQSCKIVSPPSEDFYYHVGIEQRAETEAFRIPPGPNLLAEIEKLIAGPRSRDDGVIQRVLNRRVHDQEVLANLTGSGEVLELRFLPHETTPGATFDAWARDARAVWLEVRADGENDPCLQGPIADVFGIGPDRHAVQTQPCFGLGRTRSLALPMPFRTQLEVRLVRVAGTAPASPPGFDFETVWAPLPAKHRRHYLHGQFTRGRNDYRQPFRVANVEGSGHFVGGFFTFAGASGQGFSFLEGDEIITVDDRVAYLGTGTEDYLGGAWYFRTGPFAHPFFGACTLEPEASLVAAARWHVPDPIPFTRSFRFQLEHGGANDTPGSDYSVMAFWYQSVATGLPVDPVQRRDALAPQTSAGPRSLEAEDLWPGFAVRDSTTANQSAGAIARLPAGNHVAVGVLPPGEWLWNAMYGTSAVGPARLVQANAPRDIVLGVTGNGLDVDRILVAPYLPSIREWRLVGPFPGGNRAGIDVVYGPELDWSPKRQYSVLGNGPRGWLDIPGPISANGYIDLDPLFGGRDQIVAYAFTNVISPFEQEGMLVLGSDDSVKVFWNGKQVFRHVVLRGAGRDQDRVPLVVRRGTNTLMLKIEDFSGGFGYYARIEDARGLTFQPR